MLSRRGVVAGLLGAGIGAAGFRPALAQGVRAPDRPSEFLLGYGSLIETASREGTAGYKLDAVPVRVSPHFGYRRVWNARARSGWTALGLEKEVAGRSAAPINGVLFPVDELSLTKFDRRESGYDRVAVPNAMVESLSWLRLPETGTIWIYVPKADDRSLLPDARHPILQSYVDLVMSGALGYGEAFARELVETTFGWSRYWLNDRTTARRPWAAFPQADAVDGILSRIQPAAGVFPERQYSEDYTVRYLLPEPAKP
ncbi:gamma-glutamylcyclotransferase family protein [Xanthobacteraceae bacterium A53D]